MGGILIMKIDLSKPKLVYNFDGTLNLTNIVKYYYPSASEEQIGRWVMEAEHFAILTYQNHTDMRILVDMIYYVRTSVSQKLNLI